MDESHRDFCQAAIALRRSSPALAADVPARRVYTHNVDSVLAFSRSQGGEEILVVASLNRNPLPGYRLPVPPGHWEPVLTSGAALDVGPEGARVDLPAGGLLVYRKR